MEPILSDEINTAGFPNKLLDELELWLITYFKREKDSCISRILRT